MADRSGVFTSRPPALEHRVREYAIELGGIRKSYGPHEVLKGVSLRVAPGESCALMGPSGAGKSTLLRCVNLLEEPDHGNMIVAGHYVKAGIDHSRKELQELRRWVGTVFQSADLAPRRTVLDNLVLAQRRAIRRRGGEARDRAWRALDQVGLFDVGGAFPASLTPSQLRRAAIARALVLDPAVILCDDPTAGIAPELVPGLLKVIRDVVDAGTTIVVATRDASVARRISDHVVLMDDGRIVTEGSPAEVLAPAPDAASLRQRSSVFAS